ncbi:MAG: hypothetical protein LBN10_01625 [Propionibacteriaceae bacterium]|nr:hypothetical protein [Propionibacteriaceae bacterium]
MKGAAGAAVRVPRSARVVSKEDVQRFVDDVGFPVVVKPINQGGSRDVSVVKESHDLELLDSASWVFDMEVEQYISGDVYHVDAFVDEDLWFASTARYSAPPLEFLHGSPLAHVLIEPDSDIARRLTEFLSSLLAVMSSPASSAYHLEVIEDSRGELWLCEIASRVGGAQIPELVERTYGFSLPAQSMRSACGLSKTQYPRFGGRLFTSVIMPSPGAKLAAFPSSLPFEWVDEVRLRRPVGDWFPRSKHSNDYAACVILHAPSFEVGLSRAGAISAFLREQVMWAER